MNQALPDPPESFVLSNWPSCGDRRHAPTSKFAVVRPVTPGSPSANTWPGRSQPAKSRASSRNQTRRKRRDLALVPQEDPLRDEIRDFVRSGLFLVFTVIGVFAVAGYWWTEGHGESLETLKQIRPGMDRNEVVRLLGNPTHINKAQDGSQSWFYTRGTWCMVSVHLDRDGVVEDTVHDH